MSAEARDACWGRFPAGWSAAVRLVAVAMADVVNDMHGNRFYASVGAMARKTGLADSTVRDCLAALEGDGWVAVLERRPGCATVYRWTPPQIGGVTPPPFGDPPAADRRGTPPQIGDLNRSNRREPRRRELDEQPDLYARFPTNRTADLARCALCADTGWTELEVDGRSVAVACTHPADARPPTVDVDHARRQSLRALRATRERLEIPCPSSTTPSPSATPSKSTRSSPDSGSPSSASPTSDPTSSR